MSLPSPIPAPPPTRRPPVVVGFEVYPVLYGAQRSMLELYELWHRQQRFRLHFLYTLESAMSDAVRAMGIPTHQLEPGTILGSYDKRLLRLRWRDYAPLAAEMWRFGDGVRRLLADLRADLFHCNTDRATLMAWGGARRAGCPLVTHFRRSGSFGRLDRLVHRVSTELIWISRSIRDEFGRRHHIAVPKGAVIYNGRSLPDANGPRTDGELRSEFKLPDDARLGLMVASFEECKDHETLLAAARMACERESRLYFLLAGDDVTPDQRRRRKLEAMVRDDGLTRRVLFLGYRTDVGRLMRGVDVVVSSSREEGFGGSLMEAMGYGVPCVYVDAGGTTEAVPPGRCGYAVGRGDARALAQRMIELLGDESIHRRFSENARQHFRENFRIEYCAEKTAELFEAVMARHRVPHRVVERSRTPVASGG